MTSRSVSIEGSALCYRSFKAPEVSGRPCIFFDRDGVLIVDTGYVGNPQNVVLTESCEMACALVQGSRYASAIVTNQSGIGRGYYTWSDFQAVQDEITRQLSDDPFDAVYACGYYDGAGVAPLVGHSWRKPNPGMLLAAATDLQINMNESWIIGDRNSDLLAGARAGLAGGFIIGSSPEPDIAAELRSLFPQFKVSRELDVYSACVRIIESF